MNILMPIGGAEQRKGSRTVLSRFVKLCGGTGARIVVIPAASQFAVETGDSYCEAFGELGASRVDCLHIQDRRQANDPINAELLAEANGIFLTGGDQLKLVSLINGTLLARALHECCARGVPVGGTSAGASAMSRQMIAFGRSGAQPSQRMVQLASGLGLTSLIIDQHFTQRNRLGRLITAVALNAGMVGVGLDEDTALLIHSNGEAEVIGSGRVTVVDGREMTHTNIYSVKRYDPVIVEGVAVQTLSAGQRFFLQVVSG
jgi:cyanophycinase